MTHEDKQLLLDAARAIGHPDPRISEGEWLETRYVVRICRDDRESTRKTKDCSCFSELLLRTVHRDRDGKPTILTQLFAVD